MFNEKITTPTLSYVYGIGGRDTTVNDIKSVYEDLQNLDLSSRVEYPYRYLGLRRDQ